MDVPDRRLGEEKRLGERPPGVFSASGLGKRAIQKGTAEAAIAHHTGGQLHLRHHDFLGLRRACVHTECRLLMAAEARPHGHREHIKTALSVCGSDITKAPNCCLPSVCESQCLRNPVSAHLSVCGFECLRISVSADPSVCGSHTTNPTTSRFAVSPGACVCQRLRFKA